MDPANVVIDSGMAYPILFMPKKCTTLETTCGISDNVYINVCITSPDTEGNDTSIYNGYCNVKLVDSYNVSPNRDISSPDTISIDQMPVILSEDSSPYGQSQVWIDPSRSPYVYNHYDPSSQENYSVHETGGLITVEQHNTYITQNVYNCKEANVLTCKEVPSPVNDAGVKRYRKVQESVTGHSDTNLSYYEEDEFECGVFLSQLPEEIMNETQSRIRDERKFASQIETNALKQLMSDVKSPSRQRRTILYLGHDSHSGQTIQNISYNDPGVECAPVEEDNELAIDSSSDYPMKKYQCDKCKKLFLQISSFRRHMVGKYTKKQDLAENELSFMCIDCGKTLKTQRKFEIHCLGHGDPDLECSKCLKVFASKFSLRTHMKIHDRKYPCNYCDKFLATFRNLKSHLVKKHTLFICDDENCAFVTQKLSDLDVHQHWSESEEKNDSTTQYVEVVDINTPDELEKTFKTEVKNTDQGLLNSDLVQEKISESSSLDIIYSGLTNQKSKPDFAKSNKKIANEDFVLPNEKKSDKTVPVADKDGERIRKADSVIATVMTNSIFLLSSNKAREHRYRKTCVVCQKSFDRMDDLKRHLIEHVIKSSLAKMPVTVTGRLKITCEVCQSEVFSKVDKYKAHLREHAKLTIYKCTFCDKSFSDSSNFSKHKKIHSLTYHQCDLCHRKFNSKKMIVQHMVQHMRTKPVKCRYCHRMFHFQSMLNKHVKCTHQKDKYRCRFCDEISSTVQKKWEHEWEAHSIRKMIVDCLICGAQYRKYTELKRHCIDSHSIDLPTVKKLANRPYKFADISYDLDYEKY